MRLPWILLAAVVALGWNMNGYRLLDPDEGRNAEVAREMARSNDYLVPHLGGLPYLDKPIVYFAASAALMEVLGPTELAARLPAYLATLATVFLLVSFARRRWGRDAGWLAGVAFATMPLTLAYAHTAIFDSTLTLCTTAAIIAFFEQAPVLAWAAIALGAITKGPVAIAVPLVAVIPYALATGVPLARVFAWRGLLAFAVVGLPWFWAVSQRLPEFPRYAFVHETFQRFTTGQFHRTAPFWYYLPILAIGAFPWIVPACTGLARWRAGWATRRDSGREAVWLSAWILAPLALFTINQSKLPQYVLPLMPAVALAAARALYLDGMRIGVRTYAVSAFALAVMLVTVPFLLPRHVPLTTAETAALARAAWLEALVVLASTAYVAISAFRTQLAAGAAGYAAVVVALPFLGAPVLRAAGDDRSSAALAQAIAGTAGPDARVLAIAAYPPSLPFYLRDTIAVATADGHELTSNYITTYHERYRQVPGSPLLAPDAWRAVLERCPAPTVFVVRSRDQTVRAQLGTLPLVLDDSHYAAYGPCGPHPLTGETIR